MAKRKQINRRHKKNPVGMKTHKVSLRTSALDRLKLPLGILFLALVITGLGLQIFRVGETLESQEIFLTRVGSILPKGAYPALSMSGDKQGHFYLLSTLKDTWQMQKFSPENKLLAEIQLSESRGELVGAVDLTVDAQGRVYVLQEDGVIRIFDEDLRPSRTLATGEKNGLALEVDSAGRLFFVRHLATKVSVFSNTGARETPIPPSLDASQVLSNPVRLAISSDDTLVVIESHPDQMKAKVFSPKGELERTFSIPIPSYSAILRAEVDPWGRLFFNNHGGKGISFYNTKNGEFLGQATHTLQGDFIDHPGGVFVNKWTGDIYVYFIDGFMRCRLPE